MSKAHVPPQAAGNTERVTASIVRISDGVMQNGRSANGGMWVRGLCARCNSLAGARFDGAYADFADRLEIHARVIERIGLLRPWEPPPVGLAPGLVARSILIGMFAISPNLRIIFPELAGDLCANRPHIRMPQGATLRYALYADRTARLAGPIGAHRVLTVREDFDTFAEVFFRPLAWVLAPTQGTNEVIGSSILDRQGWPRADEWPLYGPDVERTDLRNLARSIPIVRHPMAGRRDEWIEMMADEITPVLEGEIPA